MIVLRALGVVLAGLLATAACLGFAVDRSLADSADFVVRMDQALDDPQVIAELQSVVRTETLAAADRLAASAGPLGGLARSGAQAAADQLAAAVTSPEFRTAWSSWSALLYEGLAAEPTGAGDAQVQVSGSVIVVAVEPLLSPLLGDSLAGNLSGVLDFLGRDTTVSITTGVPLEQILQATGQLAEMRWGLLIAALAAGFLSALAARPRWGWSAGVLLWCAACLAGAGFVMGLAGAASATGSDYPALSRSVTSALTAPWSAMLLTVAVAVGILGVVTAAVALVTRERPRS